MLPNPTSRRDGTKVLLLGLVASRGHLHGRSLEANGSFGSQVERTERREAAEFWRCLGENAGRICW